MPYSPLFVELITGFYIDYTGNNLSNTSGQYFCTISEESPFSLQISAYRSTLGRLMRFWVSTSKSPETEALCPAALPFEVVHQRPVEVALHGPVEIDRSPHLMDMLRKITPPQIIVGIIDAILSDEDRQVRVSSHSPLDRFENASGNICNEAIFADIGIFGIFAMCK